VKIANFPYPRLFTTLGRHYSLGISRKALQIMKVESFASEDFDILAFVILIGQQGVMDGCGRSPLP